MLRQQNNTKVTIKNWTKAVEAQLTDQFQFERNAGRPVFFHGALIRCPAGGPPVSASGKGFTSETARLSCLAEAAEYLSFLQRPFDPLVTADATVPGWTEPDGLNVMIAAAAVLRDQGAPASEQALSNGLGAHPDRKSALLHGVLELVERHAVLDWWGRQAAAPDISGDQLYRACGLDPISALPGSVRFKDLTPDFGVPVAGAFSCNESDGRAACGFAAGCTMQSAIAGAWMEMLQAELSREIANRLGRGLPAAMPVYNDHACLWPAPFLEPKAERSFAGLADLTATLQMSGHQLQCADITRPEIDLPVTKALCSTLRTPGRLNNVNSIDRKAKKGDNGDRTPSMLPPIY